MQPNTKLRLAEDSVPTRSLDTALQTEVIRPATTIPPEDAQAPNAQVGSSATSFTRGNSASLGQGRVLEGPILQQASRTRRRGSELYQALAAEHGVEDDSDILSTDDDDIRQAQLQFMQGAEAERITSRVFRRFSTRVRNDFDVDGLLADPAEPLPRAAPRSRRPPARHASELSVNFHTQRQRMLQQFQSMRPGKQPIAQSETNIPAAEGVRVRRENSRQDLQTAALQFLATTGMEDLGLSTDAANRLRTNRRPSRRGSSDAQPWTGTESQSYSGHASMATEPCQARLPSYLAQVAEDPGSLAAANTSEDEPSSGLERRVATRQYSAVPQGRFPATSESGGLSSGAATPISNEHSPAPALTSQNCALENEAGGPSHPTSTSNPSAISKRVSGLPAVEDGSSRTARFAPAEMLSHPGLGGAGEAGQQHEVDAVVRLAPRRPLAANATINAVNSKQNEPLQGAAAAEDAILHQADEVLTDVQSISRLRLAAVWIIRQPDFESIVLLLILTNCVTLAMFDPTGRHEQRNCRLALIEVGLNVAFTLEIFIRATAVGNFKRYISNPWSVFDVLVVLVGYTALLPNQQSQLKAVRALRALRPLRTISRVEGVRAVVVCFMEALPLLMSGAALLLLFLFLFAVAGLQLYEGRYRDMCMDPSTGKFEQRGNEVDEWGCGHRKCPGNMICTRIPNDMRFDSGSFDNIAVAMLTVFQCMTLNGWTTVMYRAMDTTQDWSAGLFVLLVIIGAYFVVNLFLAVLKIKFGKAQTLFQSKLKNRDRSRQRHGVIGWMLLRLQAKLAARQARQLASQRTYGALVQACHEGLGPEHCVPSFAADSTPSLTAPKGALLSRQAVSRPGQSQRSSASQEFQGTDHAVSGVGQDISGLDRPAGVERAKSGTEQLLSQAAGNLRRTVAHNSISETPQFSRSDFEVRTASLPWVRRAIVRCRYRVRLVVSSRAFNHTFLALIIINTMLLAMEYDGMSDAMDTALNWCNIVLTGLFTVEIVMKLLGFTLWEFVSDRMNLFDTFVVAASVLDVALQAGTMVNLQKFVILRVLRALRVLRILKIFRYLSSLRKLTQVLMDSFQSFFGVVLLTALFVVVYATIGLHLFGGTQLDVGWPNFDSFLYSLVVIFDTLTQEDWNTYMYSMVRASNWGSAVFIMSWAILGPYIFLTLFMAVTLEAFESKYDQETIAQLTAMVKRPGGGKSRRMSFVSGFFSRLGTKGDISVASLSRQGSKLGKSTWGQGEDSWMQRVSRTFTEPHRSHTNISDAPSAGDNEPHRSSGSAMLQPQSSQKAAQEGRAPDATGRPMAEGMESMGFSMRVCPGISSLAAVDDRPRAGLLSAACDQACGVGPVTPVPVVCRKREGPVFALRSPSSCLRPGHQRPHRRIPLVRVSTSAVAECTNCTCSLPRCSGVAASSYQLHDHQRAADGQLPVMHNPGPVCEGVEMPNEHSTSRPSHSAVVPKLQLNTLLRTRSGAEDPGDPARVHESLSTPVHAPSDMLEPATPTLLAALSAELEAPTWRSAASASSAGLTQHATQGSASITPRQVALTSQHPRLAEAVQMTDLQLAMDTQAHTAPAATHNETADAVGSPRSSSCHTKDSAYTRPSSAGLQAQRGRIPMSPALAAADARSGSQLQQSVGAQDASVSHQAVAQTSAVTDVIAVEPPAMPQLPGALTTDDDAGRQSHQPSAEASRHGSMSGAGTRRCASSTSIPDELAVMMQGLAVPRITSYSKKQLPDVTWSHNASFVTGKTRPQSRIGSLTPQEATQRSAQSDSMPATISPPQTHAEPGLWQVDTPNLEQIGGIHEPSNHCMHVAPPTRLQSTDTGGHVDGDVAHRSAKIRPIMQSDKSVTLPLAAKSQPAADRGVHWQSDKPETALSQPAPPKYSNSLLFELPDTQMSGPSELSRKSSWAAGPDAGAAAAVRQTKDVDRNSVADLVAPSMDFSRADTGNVAQPNSAEKEDLLSHPLLEGSGPSLYILHYNHPVRIRLYQMTTHPRFDQFIILVILVNCILMTMESPRIPDGSLLHHIMIWGDVGFTTLFGIEAIAKILAFNFTAYMRYPPNQLDLFVFATGIVADLMTVLLGGQARWLQAIKALRALKPLRIITRSSGLKAVFRSLTLSLAAMGNVSILVLLFLLIFGILGVQLFAGKFWSCNDTSVAGKAECTGEYLDRATGAIKPRTWTNRFYNFDHLGNALLSLCFVLTLDGYVPIMQAAMSTPLYKGMQPQPYINAPAFFYFLAFIMVCTFTLLNLYTGVVFFQFSRIRLLSQAGSAFLSTQQKEWIELSQLVFKTQPLGQDAVPRHAAQAWCFRVTRHRRFEQVMAAIIAASVLVLAAGDPPGWAKAKEYLNILFTLAFVVEAAIRIGALGVTLYFKHHWNKFDFFLVLSAVADMVVSHINVNHYEGLLGIQKILRVLRVLRILKLVKTLRGMHGLFQALVASIPAFSNVGCLILLVFFIYAYLGVQLFGELKRGGTINSHANFELFSTSLLTLLRVATNDNWDAIVKDCMVSPPNCDPALHNCGSWLAIPYFLSFVMLVSIILLNVFSAVIIENFEALYEQDQWRLKPAALQEFTELWAQYDDGAGHIDPLDLEKLLLQLRPPLGLGSAADSVTLLRFVYDLDIPLINGRAPFQKTLFELVKRCSGSELPAGQMRNALELLVHRAFDQLSDASTLTFAMVMTVMTVQRRWRAKVSRNRLRTRLLRRKARTGSDTREVAPLLARRDTWVARHDALRQDGSNRWTFNSAHASWMLNDMQHAGGILRIVRNLYGTAWGRSTTMRQSDTGGESPARGPVLAVANKAVAMLAGNRLLRRQNPYVQPQAEPTPILARVGSFLRLSSTNINTADGPTALSDGQSVPQSPSRRTTGNWAAWAVRASHDAPQPTGALAEPSLRMSTGQLQEPFQRLSTASLGEWSLRRSTGSMREPGEHTFMEDPPTQPEEAQQQSTESHAVSMTASTPCQPPDQSNSEAQADGPAGTDGLHKPSPPQLPGRKLAPRRNKSRLSLNSLPGTQVFQRPDISAISALAASFASTHDDQESSWLAMDGPSQDGADESRHAPSSDPGDPIMRDAASQQSNSTSVIAPSAMAVQHGYGEEIADNRLRIQDRELIRSPSSLRGASRS